MTNSSLFLIIIGLGFLAFVVGQQRAAGYEGDTRLKSLPRHYGFLTAIWSSVPAIILLLGWLSFEPAYLQKQIELSLPSEVLNQSDDVLELYMNNIHLAIRDNLASDDEVVNNAVRHYQQAEQHSRNLVTALIFVLGLAGIVIGLSGYCSESMRVPASKK